MDDLPDRFQVTDAAGNKHDLISILNCSPEFLSALANEQTRIACPASCDNGHNHIQILGGRLYICLGPCPVCHGRGWQYGMVLS